MLARIRKLMALGVVLAVMGTATAYACDLQTGTPYEIQGAGTGSVGPYVTGHVTFDGSNITGELYGHWYGHGECVIEWSGTYTQNGTVLGGLTYDADVVATGDCLPTDGVKNTLIFIPSNQGNHFGWGTYKANSNIHGDGNIQD